MLLVVLKLLLYLYIMGHSWDYHGSVKCEELIDTDLSVTAYDNDLLKK